MYTETFSFSFGLQCLDSLGINMYPPFYFFYPQKSSFRHVAVSMNNYLVSPFIFNSLYQVGTTVCRSCGYVTTNIWEISGSWAFLQASILQICPHTGPLSHSQTPRALIPYGYLGPTLRISSAYIDHIFALHIGPVTFPEHFQHTLRTSSPQLQNTS